MIKRYLIQNWDGVSSEANMDRPAGAGLLLLPGPGITPFKVSYLCILYPLYLGWSSCQGRWVKTRWSEWQGFTIIKRGISCTSFFFNRCSQRGQEHYSSAVQESLQTEPVPSNPDSWQDWNEVNAISIDQVVLTDSIRWRDRDLGFLLPLAVTGKKIQVGSHYQSHSYVTFIDIIDMHTTSKGVLPAHESNEHGRYPMIWVQPRAWITVVSQSETWLKEQLRKCGHGNILVRKLSGLCSSGHKEQTMLDFRSGYV